MTYSYPIKVEIEWATGTWTDVSADADLNAAISIKAGRTSPLSQPQPGTLEVTLDNFDGRYTPGRTTLADGTTAAPYSPNVLTRKRVRVSVVVGGTTYPRFLGRITTFAPVSNAGRLNQMRISAIDELDRLSRVLLDSPMRLETLKDSPYQYWPLNDLATAGVGSERSGNNRGALVPGLSNANASPVSFEQPGPGTADGTGVGWPDQTTAGGYLYNGAPVGATPGLRTFEMWVKGAAQAVSPNYGYRTLMAWVAGSHFAEIGLKPDGTLVYAEDGIIRLTGPTLTNTSSFTQVGAVYSGTSTVRLIYTGLISTGSYTSSVIPPASIKADQIYLGAYGRVASEISDVVIGQVSTYTTALSAARIQAHYIAGAGYDGELMSARLTRYLSQAGLTPADYTIDALSTANLRSQPQVGKSVLAAVQDNATTEGIGSVFWASPTGLRFTARNSRSSAPLMTLDAQADIDRDTFQPQIDDLSVINQVTATQADASGSGPTQVISDAASIAAYGLYSSDYTSYSNTASDVTTVATAIVTANSTPKMRVPQLALDLGNAANDLWASAMQAVIGSRLRVAGVPANAAPSSTFDLYVEGYTETIAIGSYRVVYDTSPAS